MKFTYAHKCPAELNVRILIEILLKEIFKLLTQLMKKINVEILIINSFTFTVKIFIFLL